MQLFSCLPFHSLVYSLRPSFSHFLSLLFHTTAKSALDHCQFSACPADIVYISLTLKQHCLENLKNLNTVCNSFDIVTAVSLFSFEHRTDMQAAVQ